MRNGARILLALMPVTGFALAGEVLYNGIELPDAWPPRPPALKLDPPPPPAYLVHPPPVIPIDAGRQLFVDDFLIERTTLERKYHAAEYYPGNPVVKPDRPWERQTKGRNAEIWGPGVGTTVFSDGVWFDPSARQFKMWYRTGYTQATAMATSVDGIHWEKPDFGVVPGTNIVQAVGRGSATTWMDLEEKDPARRFKMISSQSHMTPQRLYFSPDGIHWSTEVAHSIPCGDRTTMFWNPFRRRWIFSIRDGEDPKLGRARRYLESADVVTGIQWKKGEPVWWVGADRLDPMRDDLKVQPQLYNLDAAGYESILLGMFSIWRGAPETRSKPNEIVVGYSRDGFHWTRPVRTAFIPVSERYGDWNYSNVQSAGGVALVVGDKLYFYVQGWAGVPGTVRPGVGSVGLAVLRRDGFASMEAGEREGQLLTRPVRFAGGKLFVNADSRRGSLRVEVVDAAGHVVRGFSKRGCVPVAEDGTLIPVKWKSGGDLSALAGKTVRFRFWLRRGKLYSFWVSGDASGASRGYVAAGGPGFHTNRDDTGIAAYTARGQ